MIVILLWFIALQIPGIKCLILQHRFFWHRYCPRVRHFRVALWVMASDLLVDLTDDLKEEGNLDQLKLSAEEWLREESEDRSGSGTCATGSLLYVIDNGGEDHNSILKMSHFVF